MSLRDEVKHLIDSKLSSDPLARKLMVTPTGTAVPSDLNESVHTLVAYCNALEAAVLRIAEELDLIQGE